MKTPQSPNRSSLRRAAQAATLMIGFIFNPAASPQAIAATSGTKDHVLFVGTDLAVKQDGEFYHVVGARQDALQIEKNHRLAEVRLGEGANVRISRGVKLSSLSATISNVQTESADRASARAQLAAMQASILLTDEASDGEDRKHGNLVFANADAVNIFLAPVTAANIKANIEAATTAYTAALPVLDKSTTSASTFLSQTLNRPDPIDDEVTIDASALPALSLPLSSAANTSLEQHNVATGTAEVELTFDVSSPTPLDQAYIVVVANYSSPIRPDVVARQISTKEFAHLDSHPQRVKMRHAASVNGLPFRKFDMGLYANGQEVATNLSEKRLPLTADQAYQFFLIDYLTAHKGATLPPTPVLMTPRTEFRRQVENSDANQTIYAKVDKAGNVLAVSTNANGTQTLPASVESALRNVRFMPALANGAPIDGLAKVTLAALAR